MVARLRQQRQPQQIPDSTPLAALIDPTTAARLQANGIVTVSDWARLTRAQKDGFWGITKARARDVEAAVRPRP
jgi:hypothetical protein